MDAANFQGTFAPIARDRSQEAREDDPSHIPTVKFFDTPEKETPQTLFSPGSSLDPYGMSRPRFIHQQHPYDILIYTDEACLNNGTHDARAGCAFYFRPPGPTVFGRTDGITSFCLENAGPDGKIARQTSNRAESRAVIVVLQFRV